MDADAGALASDVVAATLPARPARGRWTYGLGRLEILSAQANGVALGVVGLAVAVAAAVRLVSPPEVRGGVVAAVAAGGSWSIWRRRRCSRARPGRASTCAAPSSTLRQTWPHSRERRLRGC
jgi:Cation efflux family